jgi:hypothetical protein
VRGGLEALKVSPHPLTPGVELGAQPSRMIPFLDNGWWAEYPPCEVPRFLPVLRILWAHGRPETEEWRTPWERGEPSAAVVAHEMDEFTRSVAYFHRLAAGEIGAAERAVVAEHPAERPVQILHM